MVKTPEHILNLLLENGVFHEYYHAISISVNSRRVNMLLKDEKGDIFMFRVEQMGEIRELKAPVVPALEERPYLKLTQKL